MIGIVTPKIYSIEGDLSPNIGDEIIHSYLFDVLKIIFPDSKFYNFPLHASLNRSHKSLLDRCEIVFVIGSNFLTPSIHAQRKGLVSLYELGVRDKVVFMGAGWSNIKKPDMDKESVRLYKSIMSKTYPHSVRDSNALSNLSKVGLQIINTSCPTMWSLTSTKYNRKGNAPNCLFTLTDYNVDIENDNKFIRLLLRKFENLFFFPQGKYDEIYLKSLDAFKENNQRFSILGRSLEDLNQFIPRNNFTYVGTRLHCGIHLLNRSKDALILEVDNRAKSISKDTNLPVCERKNLGFIEKWINCEDVFDQFELPNNWGSWKEGLMK